MSSVRWDLGKTPLRLLVDTTLLDTERCLLTLSRGTLALPLLLDGEIRGYAFKGSGRLFLDAIIETDEGALGRAIEEELERPFLMYGDVGEVEQQLREAAEGDLFEAGYRTIEEFRGELWDAFKGFFRGQHQGDWRKGDSKVFVIKNRRDGHDFLVSNRRRLVYLHEGVIYLLGKRSVLKERNGLFVVSGKGKIIIGPTLPYL
ncbi:MAG: hypothetical protein ACETVR_03215 [Candidatus Bathyarchaeia archaeon]